MSYLKKNFGFFRIFPGFFGFFRVFSGCKLKFWVGLGSRSIQELRVGSGFSLGLKVWVGLGHKLGKILGLLWVKALVTLRFSGWVGSGFLQTLIPTTSKKTLFNKNKLSQVEFAKNTKKPDPTQPENRRVTKALTQSNPRSLPSL